MHSLAELNALPSAAAADVFRSCCGASRWVSAMVARRPFASTDALLHAAEAVWWKLGPTDWREAFSHHPRIGETRAEVHQDERAARWSATEQQDVATADASTHERLAETNRAYEARFGHIYIVCAAGKSAEQMVSLAKERLENDPATEVRVAAEEQRQITRLRLQKLFPEAT